ncbi:MAG: hypothetical protein JRJ84_24835, partial [Deltaproteobacteria bacterium]|nr:hypothetical protein [Deltaproteobacteria bacterium]
PRRDVLDLLLYMVTGDPTDWLPDGLDLSDERVASRLAEDQHRLGVIAAVDDQATPLAALLADEDPGVRIAVSRLLAVLSAPASRIAPVVRAAIETEKHVAARSSMVLCLGLLDVYLGSGGDEQMLRALASEGAPDLLRAAATISLARVVEPGSSLGEALEWVETEGIAHDDVGVLWAVAGQLRRRLGLGPDFSVLFEALSFQLAALEPDPDGSFGEWTQGRYSAFKAFQEAFHAVFPRRGEHDELLPEDLSTDQRRLLDCFVAAEPLWKWDALMKMFAGAGLLQCTSRDDTGREVPEPLRRYLGMDPGLAEDTRITLTLDGQEVSWPLWKAIRQVLAGGLHRERLLDACTGLEPTTLTELARTVFTRFDWLLPVDGWLGWVGQTSPEVSEAKDRYVRDLVALMVDLLARTGVPGEAFVHAFTAEHLADRRWNRAKVYFLIQALARFSPSGVADARYAEILDGSLYGQAARPALAALPLEARVALIRGVKLVRQDYHAKAGRYLDETAGWEVLDLCPTRETAELVVDALRSMGSSKKTDPGKYISALRGVGTPAGPVLRDALNERKLRRDIVLEALAAVEGVEAAETLVTHLLGTSKPMRAAAVRGFTWLGNAAEPILAELEASSRKKARDAAAEVRRCLTDSA